MPIIAFHLFESLDGRDEDRMTSAWECLRFERVGGLGFLIKTKNVRELELLI